MAPHDPANVDPDFTSWRPLREKEHLCNYWFGRLMELFETDCDVGALATDTLYLAEEAALYGLDGESVSRVAEWFASIQATPISVTEAKGLPIEECGEEVERHGSRTADETRGPTLGQEDA